MIRVGADLEINVEFAHIRGLNPSSARYDPMMTDRQRNHWPNIVLLCTPHHKHVDRLPDEYPAETLYGWKTERETAAMGSLSMIQGLTEERLREILIEVSDDQRERLDAAIDRLESIDLESAELIRTLMSEMEEIRRMKFGLDPDSVEMFHRAVARLGPFADVVPQFAHAVDHWRRSAPPM
jgi:hypothetical protein